MKKMLNQLAKLLFPKVANFANDGAPAPEEDNGTEDPGKGSSPDPGTGSTFDFREMLLKLLGLPDTAQETDITQAYNSCMATEPSNPAVKPGAQDGSNPGDGAAPAKGGKPGFPPAKGAKPGAPGQQPAGDGHAKALADAHTAVQNLAKAQQVNEVLIARCERAEGAFANERNEHISTMVNAAVAQGKLTKAEGEAKIKELANAKSPTEYEAGVTAMANIKPKFNAGGMISAGLERTIAPGSASEKYLAMVNEAVTKDPKHDFTWHWSHCQRTPEGKSLFESMKQPQKNPAFEAKKA